MQLPQINDTSSSRHKSILCRLFHSWFTASIQQNTCRDCKRLYWYWKLMPLFRNNSNTYIIFMNTFQALCGILYKLYSIIYRLCIIIFSKTQYNTLAMLMSESWTSQKPRRIILARYNKSWRTLFEMEIQMTMWVDLSSNITHNLWVINYNRFKTGSLTDVPFNKMVSFRDSRMVSLDHFQSSSKTGSIQA